MPKLIYAEPDEEITNLVDRLRSEKTEKELVFVLPAASRVMHSALNARLLMQYSNSLGKSSSVVTPDARAQSVAIETGFKVYPSVAAFEAGGALERPAQPSAAPFMAPVPNDWNSPAQRESRRTARATVPAAASAAGGAVPIGPARRPAAAVPRGVPTTAIVQGAGQRAWIIGGVAVLAVILIAFFVVVPAATVTVITPAHAVSVTPTVTGTTSAPGANDTLAVQTHVLQSQQSQQQQLTATGTKTIPGVAATGHVVFHNTGPFPTKFPAGVEVSTDSGVKFTTNADSDVVCSCPGYAATSSPVSVTARTADHTGNVGAGAIKNIDATSDQNYQVTNPQPTSGGQDAQQKTVVSQSDLDNAKKQLGDQLTQKVQQDLQSKTNGLKIVPETQAINVAIQADRKAGDEIDSNPPTFNATVTVTGQATAVDDGKVKEALRSALKRQVPAGYDLTDDPLNLGYKVASFDNSNGSVVFDSTASGYMSTAIDNQQVASLLSGKSPKSARSYLQGHIDVTDIIIQETPSFIPYLPLMSSRITIKRQVEKPLQPSQ